MTSLEFLAPRSNSNKTSWFRINWIYSSMIRTPIFKDDIFHPPYISRLSALSFELTPTDSSTSDPHPSSMKSARAPDFILGPVELGARPADLRLGGHVDGDPVVAGDHLALGRSLVNTGGESPLEHRAHQKSKAGNLIDMSALTYSFVFFLLSHS